jgi:hypothetical protein
MVISQNGQVPTIFFLQKFCIYFNSFLVRVFLRIQCPSNVLFLYILIHISVHSNEKAVINVRPFLFCVVFSRRCSTLCLSLSITYFILPYPSCPSASLTKTVMMIIVFDIPSCTLQAISIFYSTRRSLQSRPYMDSLRPVSSS